ncbi:barstar family protein [Pseudoalteromonas rubra]|uniref:barstar family protein n=1 Tax=Pseudoalteromonas rubra TaxID=43658 RepID=UPI000F7B0A81|nr:barstar family protein [Pseudoalteromonas rubra]
MVNLSDLKRVSWQCVNFTLPDKSSVLKNELVKEGFLVRELDSSLIKDDESLFSSVSNALGFPDYFGNNWDGMDECLVELDLSSYSGVVLFFDRSSDLWRDATYSAGKFLSVWQSAAEIRGGEGKPFHLCFVI